MECWPILKSLGCGKVFLSDTLRPNHTLTWVSDYPRGRADVAWTQLQLMVEVEGCGLRDEEGRVMGLSRGKVEQWVWEIQEEMGGCEVLPTDSLREVEREQVSCCSVLGAGAFMSGTHAWEVEVGGRSDWDLGVAYKKFANRKGKVISSPENGYI
ncbi:hypothetical protein AAFF_G00414810 [Aldrovandia affinis]|uniref:B30.2/SPRY domain-containing protein n=1 Tax=Aldrovandia affinis TaxID=143900 RepID=A0AAD7WJD6_9TELE|nr:hypothetical protein AAFF_G00414810 [Aldrovandia affinis]